MICNFINLLISIIRVYNIGDIINDTDINNKYSIGSMNNTKNILNNIYYLNGTKPSNNSIGTPKTMEEIKSLAFVNELNKNVDAIDLKNINSSLSEYKLCKWKLGESNYPELIYD